MIGLTQINFLLTIYVYNNTGQINICNMNLQKISVILGIVGILLLIPVLMVHGNDVERSANSDNQSDDDPIIQDIEYEQVKQGKEYANVTNYSNQTVTIEGQLTGSQTGKEIIVENVSRIDDKVNIEIETVQYEDRIGATVLTGYKYQLKLDNIYQNETLNIQQSGINKNNYELNLDNN